MSCPIDKFGQYIPEFPILQNGGLPEGRQLFVIDKKHSNREEAWDIAYDSNIKGRRYVLWRIPKEVKVAIGTTLNHRRYWYFECALIPKNMFYKLKQ